MIEIENLQNKNEKILRICPAPANYLKIRQFNNLETKSFKFQRDIYMNENILLPGNLSSYIDKFGEFSASIFCIQIIHIYLSGLRKILAKLF